MDMVNIRPGVALISATLSTLFAAVTAIHFWKLRSIKANTGLPVNYFTIPFFGDLFYVVSLGNKKFQRSLHARFGPSFGTIILGKPTVILSSTKLADELMFSNHLKLTSGILDATRDLFGSNNLGMMKNGEVHKQKRNTLMGLVGNQGMKRWFPAISQSFHAAVASLAVGNEFHDAYSTFQKTVAGILFVVIVGEPESDAELSSKLEALIPVFGRGIMCLPFQKAYKESMQAGNEMARLIRKEMDAREGKDPTLRMDFIQAILNAEGPGADAKSPVGPIWASLDSTYAFSVRQLEFLSSRPDVLQRLRAEVQAKFGDQGLLHPDCSPESLVEMPYLCAVSQEIMRYLAEMTSLDRVALEDIELDGGKVRIPKGYNVSVSLFEMIASNPFTERPEEFEPDRWLPPRSEKEKDPFRSGGGEGTFGVGLRSCPGRALAMLELRAFLVELCYYEWEVKKPAVYEWVPFPTPVDGLWVKGKRVEN